MKKYLLILAGFLAFFTAESCKKKNTHCYACNQYFKGKTTFSHRDTFCDKTEEEINQIIAASPTVSSSSDTLFDGAMSEGNRTCKQY